MEPIDRLTSEIGIAPACWHRARSYFVVMVAVLRSIRAHLQDGSVAAIDADSAIDLLQEAATWASSQVDFASELRDIAAAEFGLRAPAGAEVAPSNEPAPAIPPQQLH